MAIKFAYADSLQKELQAEVDSRKSAGRKIEPASAKKEDLVAALLADDAAVAGEAKPQVSNLPLTPRPSLDMGDYVPNRDGWDPKDRAKYGLIGFTKKHTPHSDPEQAAKGKTVSLQGDGEVYYLHVDDADPRGNTHHAKNKDHTWKGSKEQFEGAFEEVRED